MPSTRGETLRSWNEPAGKYYLTHTPHTSQATTLEVTVSKIFPAGAGWQAASLYADKLGFAADSASFALTTGVGDGIAVAAGHTGYYAVKKAVADSSIDMGEQAGVGVWLRSRPARRGSTPLTSLWR